MPAPAIPPPPAQAGSRSPLPGWLPFLVSRDLSKGFGLGGRPRQEMLSQKIKETQESVCTLYTSTTTMKEWGSE